MGRSRSCSYSQWSLEIDCHIACLQWGIEDFLRLETPLIPGQHSPSMWMGRQNLVGLLCMVFLSQRIISLRDGERCHCGGKCYWGALVFMELGDVGWQFVIFLNPLQTEAAPYTQPREQDARARSSPVSYPLIYKRFRSFSYGLSLWGSYTSLVST